MLLNLPIMLFGNASIKVDSQTVFITLSLCLRRLVVHLLRLDHCQSLDLASATSPMLVSLPFFQHTPTVTPIALRY